MNRFNKNLLVLVAALPLVASLVSCEKEEPWDYKIIKSMIGEYEADKIHWDSALIDLNNDGVGNSNLREEFKYFPGYLPELERATVRETEKKGVLEYEICVPSFVTYLKDGEYVAGNVEFNKFVFVADWNKRNKFGLKDSKVFGTTTIFSDDYEHPSFFKEGCVETFRVTSRSLWCHEPGELKLYLGLSMYHRREKRMVEGKMLFRFKKKAI